MIDKIQRVKLRDVWPHEATSFTVWLENNIDVVNECVGLNLGGVRRERNAGVRAIAWLNESRAASFYLVKVEAIRIGSSPPAPLLTLITGPSEEATEVGDTKKAIAERHVARKKFWTELLALANAKTRLHSGISPGIYNWIGTSAGAPGLLLSYVVRQHDAQVELYIDRDKETGEGNREILDKLQTNKESIEKEFGSPLLWETLDEKRACRIRYIVDVGGWQDEEKWPQAHETLVNAMIRLEKALRPHLKNL